MRSQESVENEGASECQETKGCGYDDGNFVEDDDNVEDDNVDDGNVDDGNVDDGSDDNGDDSAKGLGTKENNSEST